jgi:fumarylacetoacetate (FAA) hydrolase
MKLATLQQGGRDGTLVVVQPRPHPLPAGPAIARTLQAALDNWERCAPQLQQVSDALNAGQAPGAPAFRSGAMPCAAAAPYQWADGSAYSTMSSWCARRAAAKMPASFWMTR